MRRQALDYVCAACRQITKPKTLPNRTQKRYVQISATRSSTEPQETLNPSDGSQTSPPTADARFEVIGQQFSLLSASLSASQNLYTRKGTLVGFNGKPENAISTLSLLGPFSRALFGIPFIYQRIASTTPFSALIGTKSPITSMVVVHLDGRVDWMIAQRNALLAWTGHTLSLSARLNTKMSLAHWGNTHVTGRGLLALTGRGQIQQVTLRTGEEYVIHPSNVIAYNMMQYPPQPYRFKASALRFQVPNLMSWLPETRFWQQMRTSAVWRFIRNLAFTMRTWTRRTIWGDRYFLHFRGPAQILIQSRGSSLRDVLTTRDVNEIADAPAGSVSQALSTQSPAEAGTSTAGTTRAATATPTTVSFASVSRDGQGRVTFDKSEKSPQR